MTNTYLLGGHGDPDDIVASTDHGVYVAHLGGGQVNTATRRLRVRHDRGLPDRGRRDHRAAPRGQPHRQRPRGRCGDIDAVGNDFAMGHPGTCGKDGQGVPVGDGVPTLRVTALTIGGTAA